MIRKAFITIAMNGAILAITAMLHSAVGGAFS